MNWKWLLSFVLRIIPMFVFSLEKKSYVKAIEKARSGDTSELDNICNKLMLDTSKKDTVDKN
jgi:hypothetical protein